jgi:hypothetical protein
MRQLNAGGNHVQSSRREYGQMDRGNRDGREGRKEGGKEVMKEKKRERKTKVKR